MGQFGQHRKHSLVLRLRKSLDEGHGFSRAVDASALHMALEAAGVRFSRHMERRSSPSKEGFATDCGKTYLRAEALTSPTVGWHG